MRRRLVLTSLSLALLALANMSALAQEGKPTLRMKGDSSQASEVKEQPRAEQTPAPLLKVKFEGLKSLSESDILKTLREHRAMITTESVNDPKQIKQAVDVIKEALATRGYRRAVVEARLDEAAESTCSITFIVTEGPMFRLTEIDFEGNTVFTDEQLMKAMKYTFQKNRATFPQIDTVFDKDMFEIDMRFVQQMMAGNGYVKARTGEPKIEEAGNALKIIIPVDEGTRYRLGEIKIEGANQFSTEEILGFLPLRQGDIINPGELGKAFYERLKRAYGERGFIQYEALIEPEYREASPVEGVVDFTITIEEGRRFKVQSIRFVGNTKTSETILRNAIMVREGEVYNQPKFEESIETLNRLGLFEPIEENRNTDFRTDEESGLLSITIRVNEIAAP